MAGPPVAVAAPASVASGAAGGKGGTAAPPARSLAFIEVRKSADSTTWYHAQLLDVCAGRAVVTFEGGVWPDREVPCFSVRARPTPSSGSQVVLQAGSCVEVLVDGSARSPMGWALGQLAGEPRADGKVAVRIGTKEYAVNAEALRPVSTEPVLDPMVIVRRAVLVPAELRGWLPTQDARGCFEQVRATAGLGLAGAGSATGGILPGAATARGFANGEIHDAAAASLEGQPTVVVLLGSEEATKRGEMLLRVHLVHQQAVEAYHARRARKLEVLSALRERTEGGGAAARVSFQVEAYLLGRTIGRAGEHLKRVGAECSVEIRIMDGSDDSAPRTVILLGDAEEDVQRAREELELIKSDFHIDEGRVGWVLSKVTEISKTAGLAYPGKWNDDAKVVELYGTRQQIDDAVMLLDNHAEYFTVFEEMGRQRDEIQRSFEALDEAAVAVGLAPPLGSRKGQKRGSGGGGRGRGRGKKGGGGGTSGGEEDGAVAAGQDDADGEEAAMEKPEEVGDGEADERPASRGGGGGGRGASRGAARGGGATEVVEEESGDNRLEGGRGRGRGRGRL